MKDTEDRKMTYYFDMDGVLANFHKAYATDKNTAASREAMANLEPFAENVATVRRLIAEGVKVYILTKARNEAGKAGKIDWLAKHIPELALADFICIVGYGRKVDFIREVGVLVDDDPKNTRQWEKAGFEAITLTEKGEAVAL
jgi:ribonucleotide monophosphatase NagD (HAD superfamily)